jgi:hypothetical protein
LSGALLTEALLGLVELESGAWVTRILSTAEAQTEPHDASRQVATLL